MARLTIEKYKDENGNRKSVAIIVAHPDDETLWAGGTILSHPEWDCFVVCMSRSRDADRAPKFYIAMKQLHAEGIMGDLDDGPEQHILELDEIESAILELLPAVDYDIYYYSQRFGRIHPTYSS